MSDQNDNSDGSENSSSKKLKELSETPVSRRNLLRIGALGAASAAVGKTLLPTKAEAQINPTAFIKGAGGPSAAGIYSWGYQSAVVNSLGISDITSRSSPSQIGSLTNWTAIAAGGSTGMGIKAGQLWTWGMGAAGALGNSDTVTNHSSPIQIGSLTDWSIVAAGSSSFVEGYGTYNTSVSAAIKTDGTLWTWGHNPLGCLGDGTTNPRSSPVKVGAATNWTAISCAGYDGVKNHVLALRSPGSLWSWGANTAGQLGSGTTTNRSSPVQIGTLTTWQSISADAEASLAIRTDGTLWSWGSNAYGQLGSGSTTPRSSPVQVGALTTWSKVSLGTWHVLAVQTNGTLWAWGVNSLGQLGDGSTVMKSSPVQIGALTTWSKVSASYNQSFAIKTDGTLWAWGQNSATVGSLGTNENTITAYSSPIQIGSGTTWTEVDATYSYGLVNYNWTLARRT